MSKKHLSFILVFAILLITMAGIPAKPQFQTQNQSPTLFSGQNVNMVSGTTLPDGDPWLQRQNEPSIAVSTRNPLHLLAGANDYRTVDMPGDEGDQLPGQKIINSTAGDAWLGVYKSFDGGQSWITTLLPGFPQDSPGSPLYGYEAAADPVVRAGVNGLFYYSGIVFNRGINKGSAVFIARFIDNNNDEEHDTIKYLDTTIIDIENGDQFKDKPWIAVDAPRNNSGTVPIDGQEIPRHNVYIVYTVFSETAKGDLESSMIFRRSTDCGLTWENPIEINKNHLLNQGATIAINPRLNGHIYVAWRRFSSGNGKNAQTNAIVAARSTNDGKSFSNVYVVAEINNPFDQGTSEITFRTNSYPSIAVDDKGTIYIAWAQQEVDPSHPGNSRIVISTSKNAQNWAVPAAVENPFPDPHSPNPRYSGHQFMPSLTFASGKLMMVWYDTRNDYSPIISPYIDDDPSQVVRHTIDIRVAQANPGEYPEFQPSIQVSRYLWALSEDYKNIQQVQFNPPNYPLFKGGTVPFHGDYVDIASSPSFVQDKQGNWQFNTEPNGMPIFHIAWVDNRDVRPPDDQTIYGWTNYTPPSPDCTGVNLEGMGMRNQNVYTARITTAVEVGSPKNNKHLGTLGVDPVTGELISRAFVIFVKNTTGEIKSFRLKITEGPQYGQASFLEFDSLDELDVEIAPYSSISRPVFVTSTNETDSVTIEVYEIDTPGGSPVAGGISSDIVLNSDPSALGDSLTEETHNPNIINPNIINWVFVNPNIINPNIINPNIINPNIINPNIINPNIINPNIINPNIINPNIINPNIINPNIINPNIINPNIINAGESVDNATITDVQWTVENLGNTASSYTFKIFAKDSLPEGIYAQLLIYKVHYTPGADPNADSNPCELKNVQSHELILNIINPNIINPNIINPNIINPNIINSSIENATFYLRPSEEAVTVLRLIEPNPEETKTLQSGEVFRIQSWASNLGVSSTAQAPDSGEEEPKVDSTDLMVLSAELDPAIVGMPYSDTLSAAGGDGTYSWSLNPNYLPPGLTYSTAGVISGIPENDPNITYPHIYSFLVQVLSAQETNTQTVSITVNAADEPNPPLNIQTTELDDGTKGSYYGATLQATGGEPPYNWEIYSGSLPDALTLDGGGTISGTIVDNADDYSFTVLVSDSLGETDTQAFTLTVNEFVELVFHTISGRITDGAPDHNPIPGVILYGLPGAPTTDQDGEYSTSVREGDSFTAEPFRPGYTFSPVSQSYAEVAADMTTEDYTASVLTYTVAGKVTINGIPLPGVVMNGLPGNPETDIDGIYQDTVPHAWSDTVTPTLEGYSFIPSSTTYDPIVIPLVDQDYTASYTGGDVDDAYEDNDNLAQASLALPLQSGLYTNLRLLDEDWFRVDILSGQDIEVHVTGIFDDNINLDLYDSSENLILSAASSQEYESVYAANLPGGLYYIQVTGSSQSVLPYSMTINFGDFNLGTISGTVTTDETTPAGLESRISVSNPFGSWITYSNVSGNYSMSLPPGEYQILFGRRNNYYLPEYHNNKLRGISADWVMLAAGETLGINAQLEEQGFITGTVTDPNGAPIEGSDAIVTAWGPDGMSVNTWRTGQNGVYTIGGLRTRNYRVRVKPTAGNYAVEWYKDKYSFDLADPVHVETALETSEIDVQLEEGGYISGRVTDSIGRGIPNLWVTVYDVSGTYLCRNTTDEQGNYTIYAVPATDVKVLFDAEGTTYISEWYNNNHTPTFEIVDYQSSSGEADLVSVHAGLTTGNINAQLDDAGNISGRVTDSQRNPIERVDVFVFDTNGKLWRTAHTDRYGKYTVDRLPAGSAKVRFRTLYGDYKTVWYPNQNSFSSGGTVTVAANQTTDGIDAQLAENGGHISGTVTDSGGQGIEGVLVVAHDSSFLNSPTLVFTHLNGIFDIQDSSIPYSPAWTFTDENGNYNIPRLPTSQVIVEFNADYLWLNYTSEYYDNKPDHTQATLVSVTAGQIRPEINAVLDEIPPLNILTTSLPDGMAGESYNGTLEAEGGQPMYSWTLPPGEILPQGLAMEANGVISGIPVVHGDFTFDVQVTDSAFTPQTDSQTISIHISQYGGVDKEISGRITSNGIPVQGVELSGFPNQTFTDANGFYTALAPLGWDGTVTPILDEFDFNPISRTYPPITDNISGQDYEATYIGGDTDDSFEENDDRISAKSIPINATTSNLKLLDDDWFYVSIDPAQELKVTTAGILNNDIDVALYDSAGNHLIESAGGSPSGTIYWTEGTGGDYYIHLRYVFDSGIQNIYTLTVETSSDFETATISGTVTDESLNPLSADVWIYTDTDGWICHSYCDDTGFYNISLPGGDYKVRVSTGPWFEHAKIDYVTEWYDDAISAEEAATLTVLSGQTVFNINARLAMAGSITGHIEDEYGNPLWSQIYVYDYKQKLIASGSPDENGDYTLERIQPGNYKLRFRPDWNHAVQWSGGQNSYAEAHPVPVHAGQTSTGIDIQLHEAGYIEGRVTDTSGNPIQGIWVYAYDESTFYTGMNTLSGNQTDENGNYTLGRLPTSNIKIWFYTWDADGSYITEIFDDKRNLVEGDTIPVFAGETASHDVVELEPGGTFSGRVTDSQEEGIRGILVWPFWLDNRVVYYNYNTTDDNGFYTVKGVPAETKIRFRPPYFGDNAVQWYDGKGSYSTADILAVPQGQTVPNIDAQMPDNGGKIMGRVTDTNGTGIGGVHIHVYDTSLEAHYTSAYTDANGYYTVRRLPTCKLKLHFDTDYRNLDYISEYYNDETTFEDATQIQVQLGQTKNIADVVLEQRPSLSITTSSLPAGNVAEEYSAVIQATGGREYYHYQLFSSTMPNGLDLHSNGFISGIPTFPGMYNFTVEVIDSSLNQQVDLQSLSITINTYVGPNYLISGTVTLNGSPLPFVELNGLPGNPLTNAAGQYSVLVYPGWNGTVTPILDGYAFTPVNMTYSNVDQNYEFQDYNAEVGHSISGTIQIDGDPLMGVLMSGLPGEIRTDEEGFYNGSVSSGWTGTVTPTLSGFTFDPEERTYGEGVSSDLGGQVYTATYIGDQDDAYEDNDDWTNAYPLSLGTYSDLVLLDIDWFKFDISAADAGKDLKIHFWGTSYPDPNQDRDLDFVVLDGSGKLLGMVISSSDDETLYLTDIAEGTYHVGQMYIGLEGTVYSMNLEVSDNFGIGYISGRVTDEQTGLGIEGIYVELYRDPFDWANSRPFITTDADGYYKVGYSPGNYTARFNLFNHYHREPLYPDVNYIGETYNYNELIEVDVGTTVTNIDAQLEPGGMITGRVTDPDGNGVYYAVVSVCRPDISRASAAYTDEDGYYTADRIRTGNYKIRFRPTYWTDTDYQLGTKWYRNRGSFEDGIPVPVQQGATTPDINIQLEESAYIEGHVTNSQGDPIRDIQVTAYDPAGYSIVSAWTDDNGYYHMGHRLPTGDVILFFNASNAPGNYVSEYYTDKFLMTEADPITLQSGQTTSNIDAQLADGGTITGRVTDDGGYGISGVAAICHDLETDLFYSVSTDNEGYYSIRHIFPDHYKVKIRAGSGEYATKFYDNVYSFANAEVILVGAGDTVSDINALLSEDGGFVTGQVTDTNGAGIEGVRVWARDATYLGVVSSSVMTDFDGYYRLLRLPAGEVKVFFDADLRQLNYETQYYNGKDTFETANLVPTTLGQETPGVDAVLADIPDLTITTTSLPNGEIAVPYNVNLEVTGGREFYHWSLFSGNLPDGLMLNGRGEFTGTPTAQGTYNFSVQVTDSSRNQQLYDTQNLSITVNAYSGTDYLISGTVTFDSSPLSGVKMQGLPGNPVTIQGEYIVAVPPNWSGVVRPTAAGYYFVPYETSYTEVYSHQPDQDYAAYELTLEITTDWLINGIEEQPYNQILEAAGGTEFYSWSLVSGSLPYGLTLDSNGTISGTPTYPDSFDFTVRVTDSSSPGPQIVEKELRIHVHWGNMISEGPILYWKLNEESGDWAFDSSGKRNHGQLYENAGFISPGYEGYAVETLGRGWIETETWGPDLPFVNEASVTAFVKIGDLTRDRMVWKLQYDRPGGWPYTLELILNINQNMLNLHTANGLYVGNPDCQHYDLNINLSNQPSFELGTFNQITITVQNDQYNIYIDGNFITSGLGAQFEVNDWATHLWVLGADFIEQSFDGQVDEVIVHNRRLEPLEVLDAYNAGPMPTISGTIHLNGSPLEWVWMEGLSVNTNENGEYIAPALPGWSGTVTPQRGGYYFDPPSRTYTSVSDDMPGEDYTAYEGGSLWITTDWLPDGIKNSSYGPVTFEADDGQEPYFWSIVSGTKPNGLILDSGGTFSGTPTEAGNFSFTVQVTDSNSPQQAATREFFLNISAEHEGFWTTTYPNGGSIYSTGLAIDPGSPNIVYAAAENRGIFKTTDSGDNWINLIDDPDWPLGETSYPFFMIHHSTRNFYISTWGRIYRSTDRGVNWDQIYETEDWDINYLDVAPSNASYIYFGTRDGEMFRTTDGGTNWSACDSSDLPTQYSIDVITVDPTSPSTLYVGMENGIYKSTDSGDIWFSIDNNFNFEWVEDIEIDPIHSNTIYIQARDAGNGHFIFKSSDGGGSWTNLVSVGGGCWWTGNCIAIDRNDTQKIYVAIHESILKTTDGGSTWDEYPVSSTLNESIIIDPSNSLTLYVGTHGEGVFKSEDGGQTWSAVNNGIRALGSSREVHSLEIDESNPNYIYSGSLGGGYRSLDGGTTWETMDFPQGSMTAILTHPGTPGTVYAGHNNLWISTDYGRSGTWVDPTNGNFCCVSRLDLGIASDDPNILYMGARQSDDPQQGMYRSGDGGVTWILKNNGLTHTDIRTIAVHPTDSQTVFAGTVWEWPLVPGKDYGLYKTMDGGDNWVYKSSGLPGDMYIHQIIFFPGDPNIMYLNGGGDNFCGLFKSADEGENWVQVSNDCGDTIAVAPDNPDLLYIGDWNGFYVSMNGGSSRMEFNGGLPRNPDVCDIHLDPNNPFHVFIATAAGVYEATFTFDFMILTDSLPDGFVDEAYTFALEAAGGTAPYTWEILSGELPIGLSMATDGTVSGTPTTSGYYDFTVKAMDSSPTPLSYQKTVNINIFNKYTLVVSADPTEGGTVTRDPSQDEYVEGEIVDVTATPNALYTFTGWTGDASGTTPLAHVQMTRDKNITANFALTTGLPDYYIVSPITSPSSASAGEIIGGSFSASMGNQGGGTASGDISVGIYLSTDTAITTNDILLWKGRSSLTDPGAGSTASITIDVNLQIPSTVSAGNYHIGILVDESAAVAESNESNNSLSAPITVTITGSGTFEILGDWSGGSTYGLAVDEARNLAFVGHAGTLEILDLSDPSNPIKRSELYLSRSLIAVIVLSGNYAVCTIGADGLTIVDVSNSWNPVRHGTCSTVESQARSVDVSGNYAYVTDYHYGLRVINIADVDNPSQVASLALPQLTREVRVFGNYAYVLNRKNLNQTGSEINAMHIVDISTPSAPVLKYTYEFPWGPQIPTMHGSGQYLFVPTTGGGVRVLDISDPSAPSEITYYPNPANSSKALIRGNYLYLNDTAQNKAVIYDVSDMYNPVEVSSCWLNNVISLYGFEVTDSLWLHNDWYDSIRIMDISDIYSPHEVGAYEDIEGMMFFLDVAGDFAYVINQKGNTDRLKVLDISNPSAITETATVDTPYNFANIAISGNYAFLPAYDQGLRVFDISDPSHPTEAGACEIANAREIAISGQYAYVAAQDQGLMIVDISIPTNPTIVSTWDTDYALSVAVQGNYAYISDYYWWSGLRIIDISDPLNPWEVGRLRFETDMGRIWDLTVSGDYVYVLHNNYTCKVIDVSDPQNPSEVEAAAFGTYYPYRLAVSGHLLFITDWLLALRIMDITNPAVPVLVDLLKQFSGAYGIAIKDDRIYVTNRDAGFAILEYKRPEM